jgi:hypothetical protein
VNNGGEKEENVNDMKALKENSEGHWNYKARMPKEKFINVLDQIISFLIMKRA